MKHLDKRLGKVLFIVLMLESMGTFAFGATFSVGGIRLNKNLKPLREIKHENVVTQSLDFSCGAAGLSTLLNFYLHDPVSENEIISALLNSVPLDKIKQRHGFSLLDLKTFAKDKGYKVSGYKMDMEFLRNLRRPVLVPIKFRNYRHFVIVKAVIADRVFIADPAAGNMSMKIDQFKNIWTDGIGLVISKSGPDRKSGYGLNVNEKDFVIADYAMMGRLLLPSAIRAAVFPGEF